MKLSFNAGLLVLPALLLCSCASTNQSHSDFYSRSDKPKVGHGEMAVMCVGAMYGVAPALIAEGIVLGMHAAHKHNEEVRAAASTLYLNERDKHIAETSAREAKQSNGKSGKFRTDSSGTQFLVQ